ncbi:MAG: hypothetical protein LBI35_00365 [Burkholderiales bacterium]|nr:hypothetical protein [Burkholderiales bacterium]
MIEKQQCAQQKETMRLPVTGKSAKVLTYALSSFFRLFSFIVRFFEAVSLPFARRAASTAPRARLNLSFSCWILCVPFQKKGATFLNLFH